MHNIPKTKIVCTIGPSCNSPTVIEDLINAGMNVAKAAVVVGGASALYPIGQDIAENVYPTAEQMANKKLKLAKAHAETLCGSA